MISLLGNLRRPDIIFRHNGHFDLTARVVRALDISPGDAVDILRDGGEFYLYLSRHAHPGSGARFHARVFPTNRKSRGHHYRGSSVRLCRAILDAVGITSHRAAFIVGLPIVRADTKCLPIITRQPL